jgi:hypothetical protein
LCLLLVLLCPQCLLCQVSDSAMPDMPDIAVTHTQHTHKVHNLTKVLVPAVYHEWDNSHNNTAPNWAVDPELMQKYGYSVFLYQKLDPMKPHYFGFNRGAEAGTYLKYIVDHYDDFPDLAIFV